VLRHWPWLRSGCGGDARAVCGQAKSAPVPDFLWRRRGRRSGRGDSIPENVPDFLNSLPSPISRKSRAEQDCSRPLFPRAEHLAVPCPA
jgi:hypothetical protein